MKNRLAFKKIKVATKAKTKNSLANNSFNEKGIRNALRLIKEKDIQIIGLRFNELANLLTGRIRQSLGAKVKKQ